MSIVYATTLNSRNEFTQSVTSSVGCFVLSDQGELVRDFMIPDNNWTHIRIAYRAILVGAPSGSTFKGLLFSGVCSGKDHRWGAFGNEHCVGTVLKGHDGGGGSGIQGKYPYTMETEPGTTIPYALPTGSYTGFGQSIWPQRIVTGSIVGGTGVINSYLCRYETEYTNSWASASIVGQSWVPVIVDIIKGNTNWTVNHIIYNGEYFGNPIDNYGFILGLPNVIYKDSLQSNLLSTNGVMGLYENYSNNINYYVDINRSATRTLSNVFNESVYGPMNSINIYWSASLGVKLAVRDVYVVQIA